MRVCYGWWSGSTPTFSARAGFPLSTLITGKGLAHIQKCIQALMSVLALPLGGSFDLP